MVVESNFKQKNYFCICFSKNTLLISKKSYYTCFRHLTRYSQQSDFFTVIQTQETTKTNNYNFLLVRENLENIAKRSDSFGIATI